MAIETATILYGISIVGERGPDKWELGELSTTTLGTDSPYWVAIDMAKKEKKKQGNSLKLQEIIWEITGRCENNCDYCGSKEGRNQKVDEDVIRRIADEISKFPPEAIDISGGDPLLVSYITHQAITNLFKSKGIQVKILINPMSFTRLTGNNRNVDIKNWIDILKLYDWIGVSINTEAELEVYNSRKSLSGLEGFANITVITNFNKNNIFTYDDIESAVKFKNCGWQIQFTMYKNEHSPDALYRNDNAVKHLFEKINKSISNGVKIIPADNMNGSVCGAGTRSIGILSNGDVVPCLSMQSWVKDIKEVIEGNVLSPKETFVGCFPNRSALQYIWEDRFKKYRFDCFKCCKDHCGNREIEFDCGDVRQVNPVVPGRGILYGLPDDIPKVTLYGVSPIPEVVAYAVSPWKPCRPGREVVVYGVGGTGDIMLYAVFVEPVEPVDSIKTGTTWTSNQNTKGNEFGILKSNSEEDDGK